VVTEEREIPGEQCYCQDCGRPFAPVSGTDEDAKTKRISGGRVEISLLKNDLEQLSSNSSAPTTSSMDQQQQPK